MLHLDNISCHFGTDREILAVDQVSLDVARGSFLSLVGPSGCGKSTLLRLIAGLQKPTSGDLQWQAARAPELGFVFQDATLMPWATVADNIAMPLKLRGADASAREHSVQSALELVGLTDVPKAVPKELSGGMRMRVSIARALALKPEMLLMDEPFGALDEITRQSLNDELLRLCRDAQLTVIFVTHSVMEAVYLSSQVAVMQRAPGRITEILEIPGHDQRKPQVRAQPEFMADVGRVSASLQAAMAQSGGQRDD